MSLEPKDVQRLGADLVKAVSAAEPTDVMLSILTQLRTNVTATEDLLRTTKIGITVNKYKVHSTPEVARAAAECVAKWRRDVKTNAAAGDKKAGKSGSPASTPAKPEANGSGAGKSAGEKAEFKTSVPLDKRTSVTDKVDTEVTGNAIRDNCLKLMYDGLANMSEESPITVLTHATAIELAAFTAYSPETSDAYKSKMRSLFQNLKSKSNPGLRLRIFDSSITPERFVRMSGEELKSKERREEDRQIQKENMDKAMVAQVEKSISSSLTCGKCGQKKVSYSQAQTRSADEPMTTFCECTVCGNRWKFS